MRNGAWRRRDDTPEREGGKKVLFKGLRTLFDNRPVGSQYMESDIQNPRIKRSSSHSHAHAFVTAIASIAAIAMLPMTLLPAASAADATVATWQDAVDQIKNGATAITIDAGSANNGVIDADSTIPVTGAVSVTVAKGTVVHQKTGFADSLFNITNGGALTLAGDGTFRGCLADGGSNDSAKGSTCTDANKATMGGVINIPDNATGSLTVTGDLTFERFLADAGGVINIGTKAKASVTVSGGTFRNNVSPSIGGGAIRMASAPDSTLAIKGGADQQHPTLFEDNRQELKNCDTVGKTNCLTNGRGGGAIRMEDGSLTIQGNVLFKHNGAMDSGFNSGGGAVWAQGTLHVKNDETGKPRFENNWASIVDPFTRNINENGDGILRGGAGGALFLNENSTAYLTGGTYTNNVSGYLGGAIYTEDKSTTYVGKTVAYDNWAGHFGGGLWFCPSGNSTASKGGNIALFDNHVNATLDANPDNNLDNHPNITDSKVTGMQGYEKYANTPLTTVSGSDLSIMNPWWKWVKDENHDHHWIMTSSNQFQLLNTWFTNRSSKAVDWVWDNVPLKETSGYHDSWLPLTYPGNNQGVYAVLATTDGNDKAQDAPAMLQLQADDNVHGDYIRTGVGLKATNVSDADKAAAKTKALMTLTGNKSRLSGGGFASNGVVVFDSPYSMGWEKVDSTTKEQVKTASTWTLTTTAASPYLDGDMRPTDCPLGTTKDDCWHEVNGVWTVDIVDNGSRDNDPDFGSISLDNLAPATYLLTEKSAPTGYQKTENVYTFTIDKVNSGDIPKEPDLSYAADGHKDDLGLFADSDTATSGKMIGNKPVDGKLEWTKTDDGNKPIAGSQWTLTGPNGLKYENITDCTKAGECKTDAGSDTNAAEGKFTLDIKLTKEDGNWVFPDGTYTLTETQAPDGYWKTGSGYTLTLGTDSSNNRTVTWSDDGVNGEFANKPTRFAWSKVDKDSAATLLGGSEWMITQLDNSGNPVDDKSWKVVDCQPGSCETPQGGLADVDTTKGGLAVEKLLPGKYRLTETKAPDGYAKTGKTFDFTIGATEKDSSLTLPGSDLVTGNGAPANAIGNARMISVLPFTGGWSARSWLIAGGVLAGVAALVAAIVAEYRRRKAAIM